jgi:hypothetical protein
VKYRALILCECSGRVREAFARRGWEAWSADLLATEEPSEYTMYPGGGVIREHSLMQGRGRHYQGDCRDLFSWNHPANANRFIDGQCNYISSDTPVWDLIVAHPPCDHLSLAGANRWAAKRADGRQAAAEKFFHEMLSAPSPLVAVENPRGWIGAPSNPNCVRPSQIVHPWMFGDPYEKATCLWLKGLPELVADQPVDPVGRITTGGGSWRTDKAARLQAMNAYEDSEGRKNRAKVRSRTMPGFARAMAEQFGSFAENYYQDRSLCTKGGSVKRAAAKV